MLEIYYEESEISTLNMNTSTQHECLAYHLLPRTSYNWPSRLVATITNFAKFIFRGGSFNKRPTTLGLAVPLDHLHDSPPPGISLVPPTTHKTCFAAFYTLTTMVYPEYMIVRLHWIHVCCRLCLACLSIVVCVQWLLAKRKRPALSVICCSLPRSFMLLFLWPLSSNIMSRRWSSILWMSKKLLATTARGPHFRNLTYSVLVDEPSVQAWGRSETATEIEASGEWGDLRKRPIFTGSLRVTQVHSICLRTGSFCFCIIFCPLHNRKLT